MSKRAGKRANKGANEPTSGQWANKRANEPMSGQMSQWAGKWANEWENEKTSGKMSGRAGKCASKQSWSVVKKMEQLSMERRKGGGWRSQIPMNQMTWNFWVSVYMIIEHRENGRRKLGRQEPWYPLSNTYDLIWWLFTLKNSNFRPSKITGHRRTDQRANRVMKF